MKLPSKLKTGGSKVIASAMSVVLAVGLAPLPAFAANLQTADLTVGTTPGKSAAGLVICAGFAANIATPEFLGLSNPNYRDNSQSGTGGETERATSEPGALGAFFGDESVNESVDPYLYNYVKSTSDNHLTPYVCWGGRADGGTSKSGSPMSALQPYDTQNSGYLQNAVWKEHPHIILGTGASNISNETAKTMYQTEKYLSSAQLTAMGAQAGYKPYGVTYDNTSLNTIIDTVYNLAVDAEEVLQADSSLKTRYESPLEIAKDYERYARGMKGYVLQAIDSGKTRKKTVALVQGVDSSADGTLQITTSGMQMGTAPTNRYLEGVTGVANDYYDMTSAEAKDIQIEKKQQGKTTYETRTVKTVKLDDLKKDVDLIITNDAASKDVLTALNSVLDKTYYVTDANAGATFMMTVNSADSAQNVGRILPCLYPEVLDQSDMIAYYYDTFYHIKDSAIASMVDKKMDGVRNWASKDSASYTTWQASDVSGYNHDTVENMLKAGINYLSQQSNITDDYLKPTNYVINDVAYQTITASNLTKTFGDAAFSLGAKTSGDGKLTYKSSDAKVATVDANGKVTIKGAGTTKITVTAAATKTYANTATKEITLTVKKLAPTIAASDISIAMGTTASLDAKTNGDGTLSYESADKSIATVDAKGTVTPVAVGSTTITVKAAATNNSEAATKSVKVTVTDSVKKGTKVSNVAAGANVTVDATSNGNGEVTVTKGSVASGKGVTINEVTVNGQTYKVTAVAANAFKGTKAKTVAVGANVKTIGAGAFLNATKLTKATIGNNVTSIGKNAFKGNTKLKTVTLGKSVKSIGKNAFKGDKKLKKVTLKSSKLTKTSFKNMIKGSKIKTVKLSGVSKKAKKNYKKWAKSLKVKVK